jgi:hypothetical protein
MFLFLLCHFFLNYFLQALRTKAIGVLLFYKGSNMFRNLYCIALAVYNICGIAFKCCSAGGAGFYDW